jgi:dGTP triphosphohydrolase
MRLYTDGDYTREARGPGSGFSTSEPYRSDFRRDYGRLIHCAAFRRLVGKTQLFPGIESDFFRNRLTHSLEVAQIGKSIEIFRQLGEPSGFRLLPEDFRRWSGSLQDHSARMRVVCDFIAGMTDRYAVEFCSRLRSESPQSMFKPI